MYWYRAEMTLGRPAIVGSTVKQPAQLPAHVLADEKHTGALGHEVYVATTVGGARAVAHLQPSDGVHRRLGRHAERLEAPLPDGGHYPVFPPLGPQDRRALWA